MALYSFSVLLILIWELKGVTQLESIDFEIRVGTRSAIRWNCRNVIPAQFRYRLCAGTRWKGDLARKIMGKNCHSKFFWKWDGSGHGGVGILIKEKWSESVLSLSLSRVNPRIMLLKMLIKKTLVSVYATQVGLSNHHKDEFYEQLLTCISSIEGSEIHIILEISMVILGKKV